MTPTLVSRVDDTPRSVRPQDGGSAIGRDGKEVNDPAGHPQQLAIEPDPNPTFEHWDEYWRKIHGPKFAYEEPGSTSQLVVRYDQLHRQPVVRPTSFVHPIGRWWIRRKSSFGDPAARVPAYGRPRWDGLAYIAYRTEDDIKKTLGQPQFADRIIADEQTAFRMVTRQITREHPSALHRDPISLVKIHCRRPEVTRASFQERWLGEHADFMLSKAATHTHVRRYAQRHYLHSSQDDPEGSQIDGISVLAFASVNDVEDYLVSADYVAIEAQEAEFTGDGSEFWTAVNYSVINRLLPELSTKREQN